MPDIEDFQVDAKRPVNHQLSALAPWQRSLFTWQLPIVIGPLVTVLIFSLATQIIIPKPWRITIVLFTAVWFVALKGYLRYIKHKK